MLVRKIQLFGLSHVGGVQHVKRQLLTGDVPENFQDDTAVFDDHKFRHIRSRSKEIRGPSVRQWPADGKPLLMNPFFSLEGRSRNDGNSEGLNCQQRHHTGLPIADLRQLRPGYGTAFY